jgi:hypothetical protein
MREFVAALAVVGCAIVVRGDVPAAAAPFPVMSIATETSAA